MRTLFFLTAVSLVTLALACSSSGNNYIPINPDASTDAGKDASTDAGKGGDSGLTGCLDAEDCVTCCQDIHPTGATAFLNALVACACTGKGATGNTAGGPCATECATECANPNTPQVSDACYACLYNVTSSQTPVCSTTVLASCQASSDCVLMRECVSGCE